jgi:8-oxo-dGTP pyrophosphatase MutT (NUDIX family)
MTAISDIRGILALHPPRLIAVGNKTHAAVALVLHEYDANLRLLFIERAERRGDPWSGHLAFPGGRVEPHDLNPRASAERETSEEIGLDLRPAEYLGRLDDVTSTTLSILVSGFVYTVENSDPFELNAEVKDVFWVPVDDLIDANRQGEHSFQYSGTQRRLPAIDLLGPGRPLLWGLTYRFVAHLLHLMGHSIPGTPQPSTPD